MRIYLWTKIYQGLGSRRKQIMKVLITGGNRGLGLHLVQSLHADSLSRSNGVDITKDHKSIGQISLQYDVVINNAFDGPPQESWANFAQVQVYLSIYDAWKEANKSGYIFNIGSCGSKAIVAPEPRFETYRISKAALEHASRQGTQAFKQNLVSFRTTLITLDRLDTPLSRSRSNWTGNGIALNDVEQFVRYALNVQTNTCIEEVSLYCNLEHTN
jgi:NAD(P)-dependent dehydrogenase (short-subunit alcohol dehydrogenase family)